ncbi:hypothetical protein [Bacillus paranthracis]|uniref:hypothetical protein n=1 Tax=Bacillus cereus group TaxID=86661 RepID=UPI000A3A7D7C|nr:hypothetical protein BK786_08805 [Bacillus thuringiensis serovar thailandensis]
MLFTEEELHGLNYFEEIVQENSELVSRFVAIQDFEQARECKMDLISDIAEAFVGCHVTNGKVPDRLYWAKLLDQLAYILLDLAIMNLQTKRYQECKECIIIATEITYSYLRNDDVVQTVLIAYRDAFRAQGLVTANTDDIMMYLYGLPKGSLEEKVNTFFSFYKKFNSFYESKPERSVYEKRT